MLLTLAKAVEALLQLFQWAPTLGGECYTGIRRPSEQEPCSFNGHPPLGVNATKFESLADWLVYRASFNGHPPLGVNATRKFAQLKRGNTTCFNGHPPLGVNATDARVGLRGASRPRFNGHPPLGVNATGNSMTLRELLAKVFQWAPTLGGECYRARGF